MCSSNSLIPGASACATAFEWVGLPEGLYHLGLAALYLATAPKSNSVGAVFGALAAIDDGVDTTVPIHLRTSPRNALIAPQAHGRCSFAAQRKPGPLVPDR